MTTTLWIVGMIFCIICGVGLIYLLISSAAILSKLLEVLDALVSLQKALSADSDTLSCIRSCKDRRTATELIRIKQVNVGRKALDEEVKRQEVEQANVEDAEWAKDGEVTDCEGDECRLTTFCGGDGDE